MKTKKQNATHNRLINITVKDNCKAIKRDHKNCVIARAVKRETGAEWVDVGASRVLVKRKHTNRIERYLLKPMAREQVRFFDKTGNFAPCQIILSAPPKLHGLRKGDKARSGPGGRKNKTLATR